ncbi:hypothetical protein LSH36_236g01016 [Paralvinella palmiformis]|uniref:Uncharacterized protein n=1 Tax=Paralvinella palmiformis TaxID=53620 RepID=A0AAD9N3P7_9ANNE|nr:hypothetical protein LSH36_236g01016 [Paralvinella palmiformis]
MSADTSRLSEAMASSAAACNDQLNPANSTDSFHRIPSESSISKSNLELLKSKKPWERSQSALDLEPMVQCQRSGSAEYGDAAIGGKVSEHSRVYWDLSRMEDDGSQVTSTTTSSTSSSSSHSGKFKISLQTIHQKEEMKSSSPSVSIQARVVRRMSSETSMQIPRSVEYTEVSLPASGSPPKLQLSEEQNGTQNTPSPGTSHTKFLFTLNQSGRPNLTVVLANTVPVLQDNIKQLRAPSIGEQVSALKNMLTLIEQAWAMPSIGRDVAYGLCDVLRTDGGLEILIQNCATDTTREIKLGSARVLEQTMTVGNREYVAQRGLEVIVKLASSARDDLEMAKATTGILECLFKHSEYTCHKVIRFGGLDTILYSCRQADNVTLKHCAVALANLAIFGGEENQHEMITHNAPEWLFPLAFSSDDSTRYYAILAISVLSANKELEPAVTKSGTLELVEPFIRNHDPLDFAKSDKAHVHGQSNDWLQHLVPILGSRKPEAQSLAAFHFAMEAGIKAQQGKLEVVRIPHNMVKCFLF